MSHNNSKRQRQEEDDNDNVSINSSMDNTLEGGAKDAKLAALEVWKNYDYSGIKIYNYF
jgi:hypothetical protein